MKVFIMQGAPGSGKTLLANRLSKEFGARILSADDYFTRNGEYKFNPRKLPDAHAVCLGQFVDLMQNSTRNVVVDNCHESAVELAPYVALAFAYGAARVEVVIASCNPDVAWKRNTHGVPIGTVRRVWKVIEETHLKGLPRYWSLDPRFGVHCIVTEDTSAAESEAALLKSLMNGG